jgi:PKD repeat protein
MKGIKGKWFGWLGLVLVLVVVPCVRAVILEGTGNPSYNTNAPTGSLTNSGWQYEGQWYVWRGTPIAPMFFLTAHHINGNVGDPFIFNGVSYTTVANFDDPDSDLRIWQVSQTFPSYAPLYTKSNEVGSTCVVIGDGTDRGPAVIVGGVTNGWQWGNTNNIERWGENNVSGVYTDTVDYPAAQLLYGLFERTTASNECDLSYNDSGGGMFIQNGGSTGTWELAGINYSVSDPYVSTNADGEGAFNAALMDYYDLYVQNSTGAWEEVTEHEAGAFYCTRVSARISWINSILTAVPAAVFSASPTNGAAPLTVTFTDSSTGPISNRFWSFGDGSTTNFASATNPTHTYTDGVYSVTLIVSGVGGSSTNTVANMINVYDPFAWWQQSYFDCTNCAQAQPGADPYGTGMSNTNKFLAGFNPTDSEAYLHIISFAETNTTDINVIYLGSNGDTNYVPGVISRTNVLEFTTGTASGGYSNDFESTGQTNILSGGTGTGIVTNMVDPGGATNIPSRFYRVRVLLP